MLINLIVGAIHESPEENTLYRKMPYFVFCFRGRIVIRPYKGRRTKCVAVLFCVFIPGRSKPLPYGFAVHRSHILCRGGCKK